MEVLIERGSGQNEKCHNFCNIYLVYKFQTALKPACSIRSFKPFSD